MSEKKAKEKRVQEAKSQEMPDQKQPMTIPIEQVLQAQFAKVGQLAFQLDIMAQQMKVLEDENNKLKAEKEGKDQDLKVKT